MISKSNFDGSLMPGFGKNLKGAAISPPFCVDIILFLYPVDVSGSICRGAADSVHDYLDQADQYPDAYPENDQHQRYPD